MIDKFSILRLSAVILKYICILLVPVMFSIGDVAVVSLIFAAERFISFINSMEVHSYFNRKLINRNYNISYINNQHIPILIIGFGLSLIVGIFYTYKMELADFFVYIMIIAVMNSIQNEMMRRAQALGEISTFSVLNAFKSFSLAISMATFYILDFNDLVVFIQIFSIVSVLVCVSLIAMFKDLCVFSRYSVTTRLSSWRYLKTSSIVLNKFFIQGSSVFGLAIIERSLIAYIFNLNALAAHYVIQSVALAALVLMDIFYWGPNYNKLIAHFSSSKVLFSSSLIRFSRPILYFQIFIIFSFVGSLLILGSIFENWGLIIYKNPMMVACNILLIFCIPVDTFLTYFLHSKKRDMVNAISGIAGLLAMAVFFYCQI